ncbi:hypothetical protein [Afifella marina]|uniref:Uncharacterized conserved protein, DUF433 family n=1 Tax=Afifella marina DSM 2698 TaxID=1120955 RepID=A0A1G5M653_AFIMA|nr:hypothetical protein [Afifella marina]MBK1622992.1 hypothetical protein [Afifella marina DSM 2698]MBK1625986.1 hypothetical protein [Afifella marina]MBK5917810.1 hypothetical protein [Afifella marina]RAI18244.1 hypothetical protein CH311_16290 [Afifella marina DSM 2698]SCZ20038.1 Uncharacterized conserved protein, DUF433 family [Afifella marina DSM 2698]
MDARVSEKVSGFPFGIGAYSAPEAARLLKTSPAKIRRWLSGYSYRRDGLRRDVPPLWEPELAEFDEALELGFRDLVELRFVKAFLDAGLGLKTIRTCLGRAQEIVGDTHAFSTRRFRTDGETIFLQSLRESGGAELLDLKKGQYAFGRIVERTFKDLDLKDETVVRWRPFRGKGSIVIDPERSFGKPITAASGVPTAALADAVEAEGSVKRVAHLFEVAPEVVRDAVRFEQDLKAA